MRGGFGACEEESRSRFRFLLAAVSLFADLATEMLTPILPVFLTQKLLGGWDDLSDQYGESDPTNCSPGEAPGRARERPYCAR
jgi:hypothetical protein